MVPGTVDVAANRARSRKGVLLSSVRRPQGLRRPGECLQGQEDAVATRRDVVCSKGAADAASVSAAPMSGAVCVQRGGRDLARS